MSYVIYSYDENEKAAETIRKQLARQYKTDAYVKHTQSAEEFVSIWNNLPDDVDAIVVITHAHVFYDPYSDDLGLIKNPSYGIGFLQFLDDQSGNVTLFFAENYASMSEDNRSINDITPKAMSYMHLIACNTSNPDFKANIAQVFFDNNPFLRTVVGYDGGVAFYDPSDGPNIFKWGTAYATGDDQNPTFDAFRAKGENPNRERQGKVTLNHYYWEAANK